jgi:hypothetical protein
LVNFRQRLLESGKSDLALRAVVGALAEEGFIAKGSKQRLDSTHILGVVARLSALECVRETPVFCFRPMVIRLAHEWDEF